MLERIDEKEKCIIHNVGNYFLSSDEYVETMLRKSKILIGNSDEFDELLIKLKLKNPKELFELNQNLNTLFVTLGKEGSQIYDHLGNVLNIPADKAVSTSPVGAGDSYSAGIVYGVENGWTRERSARFASKIASISVESLTSYPDLEKIKNLIHNKSFEER